MLSTLFFYARAFLASLIICFALTACEVTDAQSAARLPVTATQRSADWPALNSMTSSAEFSKEGLAKLEARMTQFISDGDAAGIATLLVRDGEVIHYMKHGIRNAETGAPIMDDTIYRIYSMTKPITGVAMMMLYEQGKFSLDDPITKYIPEFENLKVLAPGDEAGSYQTISARRPPIMRELMSHTAGFAYGLGGSDPANTAFREKKILASPDLNAFIDRVADVPLLFQPGENWYYSAAVDIQGAIIERLSGMSLGDFFETKIFSPLGMNDTGFYVPEEDYDRLSDVYGYHPRTKEFGPYRVPAMAFKKETIAMESGGGGLVSTMRDYARFCQMLANGGALSGNRLLKPETVKLMRTNVLDENIKPNLTGNFTEEQMTGLGFGLDFGVIFDAQLSPTPYGQGTYFWGGAAGTWFWIDPANDLFFVGMIQRFPANGPVVDFRSISAAFIYGAMVD